MKKLSILFLASLFSILSVYAQLPDKSSKESKKAYNRAVEDILNKQYDQALSNLDSCLKYDEIFAGAMVMKAKVKIEMNQVDAAVEDLLAATFVDPSHGESYFYLGYLEFENEADPEILDNFNKAIANGYTEYPVYFYRGLYYLKTGDYMAAIEDFSETINRNEEFALAYHERGTAKRLIGDMQGALYDYRTATNYRHNFPEAFNNIGIVKVILGDYEGAVEDYNTAINLDPEFYRAYNNRGTVFYYLGETDKALKDFDKALSINSESLPASNNKAGVTSRNGENAIALSILNEIIEADDSYAFGYLNRGLVRELTGDLDGACEDWNMAFELGVEEAADYLEECN